MPEPVDIVIDEFLGINTEDEPTNLPKEITNDCQNVFGSGTFVAKRPGISTALTDVARAGEIYDLLYTRLHNDGVGGPPAMLFMIYRGAASAAACAGYDPVADTIEDYGATAHTDTARIARYFPAQADRLMIGPTDAAIANWEFVEHFAATAPFHQRNTYARFFAADALGPGAWHREHMWWVHRAETATAEENRAYFSAFNDPLTLPAANNVDVDPTGTDNTIRGITQSGDALYLGRTRDVFVVTGADVESFVLEETRIPFGFHGERVWALLTEGQIIGFTSQGFRNTGSNIAELGNIGVIAGLAGKTIGDKIISLIRLGSMGGARVKDWPELQGTLFAPETQQATVTRKVFREKTRGTFWPWTIASSVRPNAMDIGDQGLMYVGCADGHIRRYDTTLAQDSGSNFALGSHWSTPPLWFGQPHRQWAVDYLRVTGTQTSGTNPTFAIATDFGAFGSETSFALSEGGVILPIHSAQGYYQQIRFTFNGNAVGSRIHKIVIGALPLGR